MNAGLNLFSIRNLIKTEDEFLDTALKLREMGYSYLQYSGAEFDPDRIKRVSDESGLPVILTHVPFDRIIGDTEALMEEHSRFGCTSIGLGALNSQYILDEKELKTKVDELNRAGEIMAKNGFNFCYHHHAFEFYKLSNNETVFDYMLNNAPYINFTVDTYWLQYGGVSVLEYINKVGKRMAFLHLKDYKMETQLKEDGKSYRFVPDFAPVGDGNIDFKTIVQKAKDIGLEYFLVEQDNAALKEDSLGEIRRSIEYIKNNFN